MGPVRCDGTSTRGSHSALDIHLLSDHLSVTFPRLRPAWSPWVLLGGADMHCWRVTGFWRGPRASSRLRQVPPYMMWGLRTDEAKRAPSCRDWRLQRDLSENQGPLEALWTGWRLRVQQEFTFLLFCVAYAVIQNRLCRVSAWGTCSRALEQEKYSRHLWAFEWRIISNLNQQAVEAVDYEGNQLGVNTQTLFSRFRKVTVPRFVLCWFIFLTASVYPDSRNQTLTHRLLTTLKQINCLRWSWRSKQ